MMQQEVIHYLARKVIEDIRAEIWFDDDTAKGLNERPLMDAMRGYILDHDIPALMKMAQANSLKNRALAITLLWKFDTERADVKSFLLEDWQRTISEYSYDYDRGMPLIWRLLDNAELNVSIHRQIRDFVAENYRRFIDDTSQWYGGPDMVLLTMKKRLSDSEFHRTKDWIYLYVALGSTDREGAKHLIASYMQSKDALVLEVATELCQHPCLNLPLEEPRP